MGLIAEFRMTSEQLPLVDVAEGCQRPPSSSSRSRGARRGHRRSSCGSRAPTPTRSRRRSPTPTR
ncbi:hypothetical protein ACFQL4_23020 [Halosimplex aquaticum]